MELALDLEKALASQEEAWDQLRLIIVNDVFCSTVWKFGRDGGGTPLTPEHLLIALVIMQTNRIQELRRQVEALREGQPMIFEIRSEKGKGES